MCEFCPVHTVADCSYDLWDLGEFEQKGSRGTKWGTKEELKKAIDTASDNGIITYIDAVLNHKCVLLRATSYRASTWEIG